MIKQSTGEQILRNLCDSGLFSQDEIAAAMASIPPAATQDGETLVQHFVAAGKLTAYQAAAVREGNFDELVIGNYLVLDRLGAGGMGTVFRARHRRMKRIVAIKVLAAAASKSETFVQRFQREVEAVARLSHPNIVMAYDADEAEAGHFLVMEFVNGRDLASEVQQRGPLPVAEAVDCILQAARAMEYAHQQGIIHRDIKPANLMRDVHGVIKVADLGLARFNDTLGEAAETSALTQAGTIMGTIDFMPPEQAMGAPGIDHRADIYSLGCTLYALLVGQPPYQGATLMATLLKHRDAEIPSIGASRPEVPAALDAVYRRMVAKKPEDRYPSMAEVIRDLEALAHPPEVAQQTVLAPATKLAAPSNTVAFEPGNRIPDAISTRDQNAKSAPAHASEAAGSAVLLAEPSRTQAGIIRGYLQKLGFHDITTVPTGQQVLELARNSPPRVVISTMQLTDMTGILLAQTLRTDERFSDTQFILIASQADSHEAKLLRLLGPNTVELRKPFDLELLAQALSTATAGQPPQSTPSLEALRVLVVDDSAAARANARRVLTGLGLDRITEAADGAEALTLLGKESFGLVVTDYNMPYLDGRGLIDFIRNRSSTPTVPIIVVTTETDPAKLEAVRQLGVTGICDKSFKPEVVRALLERLR